MKHLLYILISFFFFQNTFAQESKFKKVALTLSGGKVSFGSGDITGYSISFGASKNLVKNPSWGFSKFLLGAELIFENGVKNPKFENPTLDEFLYGVSFRHVSNTVLWTKATYYPFKDYLKGFNIQLGPTFGYSYRSTEGSRRRVVDALGNATRQSMLQFDNGYTIGYRVSVGADIKLIKNIQTGFRVDFSNNNKAEINTLAGFVLGVAL